MCRIEEAAKGHVGIPGALLFVHVEVTGKKKRNIVLHTHVDDVLDGVELKIIRVVIIGLVDGIVQLKSQTFPFFRAEESIEQSVLVASVYLVSCLFLHGVSLPQRDQRESVVFRVVMTWNVRRESNQNPNTIRSFRPLQNRMEWDCFMHRLRSIKGMKIRVRKI